MKKSILALMLFCLAGILFPLAAQTVKLSQSFEGTTFPPAGWTTANQLGAKTWLRTDGTIPSLFPPFPHGSYIASIDYETTGGNDWLITPQISGITTNDSLVFFWIKRYSDGPYPPDSCIVRVSTNTNMTGDFTHIIQKICVHCTPVGTQVWNRAALSLSAFSGNDIYIAFEHKDVDGHGMGLDSVRVLNYDITDLAVIQNSVTECDTLGWFTPPITLANTGTATLSSGTPIPVHYKIDGNSWVSESLPLTSDLLPGDTTILMFTTAFHFNQFTTHNCRFAVSYPGDIDVINDSASFTVTFFELPVPVLYGDADVCLNATHTYTTDPGMSNYQWSISGGAIAGGGGIADTFLTVVFNNMSACVAGVNYEENGCPASQFTELNVSVHGFPSVNLGTDTTLCADASIMLDAGNPGADFSWWNGTASQTLTADTSLWNGAIGPQYVWVDVDTSGHGCYARDTIILNWTICTGIEENTLTLSLTPNPGDGIIHMSLAGNYGKTTVTITDLRGSVMLHQEFVLTVPETLSYDLRELPAGIYLIRITQETQTLQTRYVKQ